MVSDGVSRVRPEELSAHANSPGEETEGHVKRLKVQGNELNYRWWQYQEADTYDGTVELQGGGKPEASFPVPQDAGEGKTIHIICEVTDSGTPPLTRYQRVVAEIQL